MIQTALELIQNACYEAEIKAPETLIDPGGEPISLSTTTLIKLFYATGRELRQSRWWPQLQKTWTVRLESGRSAYPLPPDFYASIPHTNWDQQNKWEMLGPLPNAAWDYRLYGYVTLENRKSFRVFGPDMNQNSGQGQFIVQPVPGDGQAGQILNFEYISWTWLLPPNWTAGTSYLPSAYANCAGNIYQRPSAGGTLIAGAVPPNMAYGTGQDGGVTWLAIFPTAYVALTPYAAGEFVTNGGNLYRAMQGGISVSGPTGTEDEIVDGTVIWSYIPTTAWLPETTYGAGDYILTSGRYYLCNTPGTQAAQGLKTGKVTPTWTATTVSDGTIVWTFKSSPYETILTDNDLCLFDDMVMIAGLKWRFMRMKGVEYQDLKQEYELMKDTAVARYMPSSTIRLAGGIYFPAGLNPNVPPGNYGDF